MPTQPATTLLSLTNQPTDAPLSPLDGRYRAVSAPLAPWLSEEGLNRARLHIEVEWFIFAMGNGLFPSLEPLNEEEQSYLRELPKNFDYYRGRLAELEAQTRHDVKAVEYLVREHLAAAPHPRLIDLQELTHFLCTSEDINNLAYAFCIKTAVVGVWYPAAAELQDQVESMATLYADIPLLARTHGQAATPTTVGKELKVFASRMRRQLRRIEQTEYSGKLNGATGTFSAHVAVLPEVDWLKVSAEFVTSLGLVWNPITTQIESHDWMVDLFGDVAHFGRIAHNLATDCWSYISLDYFKQVLQGEGSTGSSTMPHKVNPIRFENAEANLEMSNAVFGVLSETLPTSRMQRDLSDSAMQRNIGVAFGHSLVAIENLKAGLSKLDVNKEKLSSDLEAHPEVISEAIQQGLRLAAILNPSAVDGEPYALLKELTRGRSVTLNDLRSVIAATYLPAEVSESLMALTPSTYIGLATEIARSGDSLR